MLIILGIRWNSKHRDAEHKRKWEIFQQYRAIWAVNKIAINGAFPERARNEVSLYRAAYQNKRIFLNWHRRTGGRSFFGFCFVTSYINGIGFGHEYHQAWFCTRVTLFLLLFTLLYFPIAIWPRIPLIRNFYNRTRSLYETICWTICVI